MEKTDKERAWFIDWQGHDFSMRGMDSVDAVISSGLGHLTSFLGSDSLPTIYGARKYYGAEDMVCGSVNATEHSVMCAGGKEDEVETFRRLLETYPTGILSVVSDTWDLWKVCTEHVVTLKEEILARDGKLVIRPDSGDPVQAVLLGLKGLAKAFGAVTNSKGYKVITGAAVIQGDGLTIEKVEEILREVTMAGFSAQNVAFGMGGGLLQSQTRDTMKAAIKVCSITVNGTTLPIMKMPKSDWSKVSLPGKMQVNKLGGVPTIYPLKGVQWSNYRIESNMLETIYDNGPTSWKPETFQQMRDRLNAAWNFLPPKADVHSPEIKALVTATAEGLLKRIEDEVC
jgi:nicotinamide phosphoribosyltransferase